MSLDKAIVSFQAEISPEYVKRTVNGSSVRYVAYFNNKPGHPAIHQPEIASQRASQEPG